MSNYNEIRELVHSISILGTNDFADTRQDMAVLKLKEFLDKPEVAIPHRTLVTSLKRVLSQRHSYMTTSDFSKDLKNVMEEHDLKTSKMREAQAGLNNVKEKFSINEFGEIIRGGRD